MGITATVASRRQLSQGHPRSMHRARTMPPRAEDRSHALPQVAETLTGTPTAKPVTTHVFTGRLLYRYLMPLVNFSHALALTLSVKPSRLVVSRTMTLSLVATSTQLLLPPVL